MSSTRVHYSVQRDGAVATLSFIPGHRKPADAGLTEPHWELAEILTEIGYDDAVRVVVLTGLERGYFLAPTTPSDERAQAGPLPRSAHWMWRVSTGVVRAHLAIASLDKPVVAMVTGDAIGIGAVWLLAADIVVADENVRIVDNHLGMAEVEPFHWRTGVTPGDGGAALVPLFFSPSLAKEILMLAREFRASDLARMGIINWALPADEVGAKVEEVVAALLRRSAYALAWTKRLANRRVVDQLNRSLDAGISFEMIDMLQFAAEGHHHDTLESDRAT